MTAPDLSLETVADLDAALADPSPLMIFKHSTACPVSAHALGEFEAWLAAKGPAPRTALVRVIEERPVSNEIAARLQVRHQSPQAILVAAGSSLWDASHDRVNVDSLTAAAAEAGADA